MEVTTVRVTVETGAAKHVYSFEVDVGNPPIESVVAGLNDYHSEVREKLRQYILPADIRKLTVEVR